MTVQWPGQPIGSALSAFARHFGRKPRRAFPDPGKKPRQPGMRAQGCDRVILPCKVRFAQGRVDLAVADMVQQNRRSALAPFQFGHEVMNALFDVRRDGPTA